ncbi:universal stress protein [Amycolatopsis anabasis]|uniref:universal stress protein n=1 Tax=Amycolatopsis anabasis TaxID=1840409 RepID=UPI00131C924F|nr:universal stress protein [Amycolatopsis anabasis]
MTSLADAARAPVVVGFDGTNSARRAIRWAAAEAVLRNRSLRLVHCHDVAAPVLGGFRADGISDVVRERTLRWRQQALAAARAVAPGLTVETALRRGPVVPCLLHESRHAALLALGAADHVAIPRLVLGSTAATVVTRARCPVAVVRGDVAKAPPDGPVVVGVDGSPASEAAVEFGFEEASLREVELIAVHAWQDPFGTAISVEAGAGVDLTAFEKAARAVLTDRMARWQEKYPDVRARGVVVRDHTVRALLSAHDEACQLIVGTRGRGGFSGLPLGSTSTLLLNHAARTVIVTGAGDEQIR